MKPINSIVIVSFWISIVCLLFLGIKADTRSVQRDNEILDKIIILAENTNTIQKAVIVTQKSTLGILESLESNK